MHTMRVLSGCGDDATVWTSDVEDLIEEAERIFQDKKEKGYTAFANGKLLNSFDKEAEEIILVPMFIGG